MVTSRHIIGWAAGLALAIIAPGSARARQACDDIVPQSSSPAPGTLKRSITPTDLVRLRDIGLPDGSILGFPSPLAVSPDGEQVAFIIYRAEPAHNRYCRALVVLDLRPGSAPQIIDQGGEPILGTGPYRGLIAQTGFPRPITPQWSPEGGRIAYLRRESGVTQIWLAHSTGDRAHPLTRSAVDIENFAWRPDGEGIIFSTRPLAIVERAQNAREALSGFHYDARFVPSTGSVPQPRASTPLQYFAIQIKTGAVQSASTKETGLLPSEGVAGVPPQPLAMAVGGRRAWTERPSASPLAQPTLHATLRSGAERRCEAESCTGRITGIWWMPDGKTLLFLRRESWARGNMALYRWHPDVGVPSRVLATGDVIDGCVLADTMLVCTRENAVTPRHLVMIDPDTGRSTLLYDPNPEFADIAMGRVTRLAWRNHLGLEVRGDLVIPDDVQSGERSPLIVTQYFSNGFLRGATGDEYPIHVFAARGFAVLSIERPPYFATADPTIRSYEDINAANLIGWGERKSLFSAVIAGVDLAIEQGVADPDRVAITGLSDGAATVAFALINSRRFAAAAISSCCIDPWTSMTMVGPAYADQMRALGHPTATSPNEDFWKPVSIARNAAAIDTPLLMQLSDDEYLLSLETFTALREHQKPVDMYVFPNEHHIKWQPAHRLAVYQRNLDWFAFWLKGEVNPDPAKSTQFAHWQLLREQRQKVTSDGGGPGLDID